ncbi:Mechanosensitive ion channel family protein [Candidatus Zixiibacteriota bacterium]|nr:Mechanosensitive ion channel family protein [candidate division Zixibacteria bacterium]
MEQELTLLERLTPPVLTFIIIVVIGFVTQLLVNTRLRKIAEKTPWKGDDVIIEGLRGRIILWAVIIGLYAAVPLLHLPPEYHTITLKALLVLVILSITLTASSIVSGFIRVQSGGAKGEIFSTSIFTIFSRIVVMSIGLLVILQALNISITPILTALGVGGLAVALALQETLGNLFAGLNIVISGKIKVGNYIKMQSGEEGYVTDITWRSTTIKQLSNNYVIIPNSKLAASVTTNFNLPEVEMSALVEVGVAYDSDLAKVEKVTIEVAREVLKSVEGGVVNFEPFIRYHTFGDFSINFTVILRVKEFVNQYLVKHEFVKRLHKRFNDEGIVIPFPIRTLEFSPGSRLLLEKPER